MPNLKRRIEMLVAKREETPETFVVAWEYIPLADCLGPSYWLATRFDNTHGEIREYAGSPPPSVECAEAPPVNYRHGGAVTFGEAAFVSC